MMDKVLASPAEMVTTGDDWKRTFTRMKLRSLEVNQMLEN